MLPGLASAGNQKQLRRKSASFKFKFNLRSSPRLKIFKYSHQDAQKGRENLPHPHLNFHQRRHCKREWKKRDVRISFTPTTSKYFPSAHTQRELFGVDGNEKKSKPFGGRRQAKAFWGCVKGVRVRICDKKWLYGSCTLKSFFFRRKHVRIISALGDSKSGLLEKVIRRKISLGKIHFSEAIRCEIRIKQVLFKDSNRATEK